MWRWELGALNGRFGRIPAESSSAIYLGVYTDWQVRGEVKKRERGAELAVCP